MSCGEVEESKESGLRAQLRIVVCCGAGPWLSSPRLSPGNGGTGCRRKVRRAPYMPEGVLHLVACWASFVAVALLFAVMSNYSRLRADITPSSVWATFPCGPPQTAPQSVCTCLSSRNSGRRQQNQCYSTCSIAAGIFATDISDRATWLNN
jgi:hypothetical protein